MNSINTPVDECSERAIQNYKDGAIDAKRFLIQDLVKKITVKHPTDDAHVSIGCGGSYVFGYQTAIQDVVDILGQYIKQ